MKKLLALSVHLLTSSGIIFGFLAMLAITEHEWKLAVAWLLVTLFIDGIDGSLARWLNVKQVLPGIDGKSIDYVIDFANYALIPAYFIYEARLVPDSVNLLTAITILLVSSMYYGKTSMVTDDKYFEGFPVLWNMAACYLFFVWELGAWGNFVAIIIMSILHFIPLKYVYPSQTAAFRTANIIATIVFFAGTITLVYIYPEPLRWVSLLSNLSIAYLFGVGLYQTFRSTT